MPLVAQPASGTTPARVVAHADTHDALRGKPSLSMVGLLMVEIVRGRVSRANARRDDARTARG